MADTVDLNNLTEYFDEPKELEAKLDAVAEIVRNARHMIIFTGAGISTSASIPDFRGPNGVWTRRAQGAAAPNCIPLVQALPTRCHNFIKKLIDENTAKYVVSQNVDGLHRRSGIPRDRLSELHGNTFLEVCWKCGEDYEHEQEVPNVHRRGQCAECRARVPHFCHCSGNLCKKCGAMLKDSIIHFGENLPKKALQLAYHNAERADVCVVLGSSLTVSPANDIPATVAKKGGKLIIVNLQKTPLDGDAAMLIRAKTDDVAAMLDARLSAAEVPQPLAPPPTAVPSTAIFSIGNTHQTLSTDDGNTHEWEVFVAEEEEGERHIASVEFHLHPTFTPNVILMDQQNAPQGRFSLRRRGWGTFEVKVVVKFIDGKFRAFAHDLSFDLPVCQKKYQHRMCFTEK